MMEQTDSATATGPELPVVPPRLALSDEVRASLAAIRVAQEAARARARRQTVQTRFWFATSVAIVAASAFAFGPRVVRWRHGRAQAAVMAPAAPEAAPPAPLAAPAPKPLEPVPVAAAQPAAL